MVLLFDYYAFPDVVRR